MRSGLTVNLRVAHVQDIIDHHVIPGSQGGVDAYGFLNHGFLESHNRFGITTSAIEYSLSANQCIPG